MGGDTVTPTTFAIWRLMSAPYAVRVKVYAVALVNSNVNRAMPVTPTGTVTKPKFAAEPAAPAADKIALVLAVIVTTPLAELPVLSKIRLYEDPAVAPKAPPKSVPVGKVAATAVVETVVM